MRDDVLPLFSVSNGDYERRQRDEEDKMFSAWHRGEATLSVVVFHEKHLCLSALHLIGLSLYSTLCRCLFLCLSVCVCPYLSNPPVCVKLTGRLLTEGETSSIR